MARLMRTLILTLLGLIVLLSPRLALAHDAEQPERIVPRYPSYPYATHTKGYVRRVPYAEGQEGGVKLWSLRVGSEGAYLGNQGWSAGGALLLRYWRLGLAADARLYSGWGDQRPFYLGSANWTLDLVMRPHFNLRTGPGLVARADANLSLGRLPSYAFGPSVLTELEIFPLHPVVASGRFEIGRIGDLIAVSGRASVGVMVRRLEIAVAYEAKRIGDMELRGPQLGLRLWF